MTPLTAKRKPAPIVSFQSLVLALAALPWGWAAGQEPAKSADLPIIKVGDSWKWEQVDHRSGQRFTFARQVTAVTASRIDGNEEHGTFSMTPELAVLDSHAVEVSGDPKPLSFPLGIGKHWNYKMSYRQKQTNYNIDWVLDAAVVAEEKVQVPAGEFDAFKIEYKGTWDSKKFHKGGPLMITSWYAPSARCIIKTELDTVGYQSWVQQLVEFKLQP